MRLVDMRAIYPRSASLIRKLADLKLIRTSAAEGLSHHALQRIEDGSTSERDATILLVARSRTRHG